MMPSIGRWLSRFEHALMSLASASILAMMLIVGADVFGRYFLNKPIAWAYDVISIYLIGAVFFFALSDTFARGGHVRIDIVLHVLPAAVRRKFEVAWALAAACAFGFVFWLWVKRTAVAWTANEVVGGFVNWPVWLSTIVVPVGTGALILRLLLRAARADDRDSVPPS
jgi:TRAP-type C4-dicarboxylate transport system permease small subunit